jgi:hypothetical protein
MLGHKKCYLCGSTEDLTADHVPPKGFFPPPRPTNLITVPCCRSCNNAFSKDDEAVRLWFAAHIGRSPAGDWIWENKATKTTALRSPSLMDNMLAGMKETTVLTERGIEEVSSYEVPHDRVERFVQRVTKGLLTHYFPEHDYSDAVFDVRCITPATAETLAKLDKVKDLLSYDYRGDGVFQFRRGLTDTKAAGIWLLLFYGSILFLVGHTKNNWGRHAVV